MIEVKTIVTKAERLGFYPLVDFLLYRMENNIPTGRRIIKASELCTEMLDHGDFDEDKFEFMVGFIEANVWLPRGKPQRIKLTKFQRLLIALLFCCTHEEEVVFHMILLLTARANAKSVTASLIALITPLFSKEQSADVCILANTKDQAKMVFGAVSGILRNDNSEYFVDALKFKDYHQTERRGIEFTPTNSVINVIASDESSLDGRDDRLSIVDEIHAAKVNYVPVLTAGSMLKRKDTWQSLIITTNGTLRGHAMDEIWEQADKVLDKKIPHNGYLPLMFTLDDEDDLEDPSVWLKAHCMAGEIIELDTLKTIYNQALASPTQLSQFRAKYLNNREYSRSAWLFEEDLEHVSRGDFEELWISAGNEVIIGADLGLVSDFSVITMMKQSENKVLVKQKTFLTRLTYEKMSQPAKDALDADKNVYIVDTKKQSHSHIADELLRWIDYEEVHVQVLAYDPWSADNFIPRLKNGGLFTQYQEIAQVPKELSTPMKSMHGDILDGNFHTDSDTLIWAMTNVRIRSDHNENIFPSKKEAFDKIDNVVSVVDAYAGRRYIGYE